MIALYTLATLLVILIWQATILHDADGYFSYFTELTHIGICSYYWASFTQTLFYALRQRHSIERTPEYPLQRWPRIFQLLHVMLGTTIISYPILVTIVFWALLASPAVFSTKFGTWSNISIHVLNTAWSLFEMIGTNSPPPRWSMLPCMIIILALYLALAYVTHATQGFYPYSFLNPSTSHSLLAGYIIGIAVAACIVFTLGKTIIHCCRLMGIVLRTLKCHLLNKRRHEIINDTISGIILFNIALFFTGPLWLGTQVLINSVLE
ncbi:hypothetical protein LENED_010055 [Lentinula edodes]|uniref:Uncharacterized protein n=1 Tax=Lentinula edodes TaxID=5353 RepID=A0A1Q3ELE6_LENED|nr:hypothetical protein LENED_010055 [Lentinula edodes]